MFKPGRRRRPPVVPSALEILGALPWPLLLAFGSLAAIWSMYRARPDLYQRFAFSGTEVTLLALGSIAGWAVNFPLAPLGSSFLALNLGGAVLSIFFAFFWWRRGVLDPVFAIVGALLVSFVATTVVRFEPDSGIVSEFPWFFLPSVAAIAYGLVACRADWGRAVPLAYVAGSIGALLGADVYNLGELRDYFAASRETVVVSVGGAGVFDMVFLAGTLAMAVTVAIVRTIVPREEMRRAAGPAPYPGKAFMVRDPSGTWARFTQLEGPTTAERATAALALSESALHDGDFARSVRMAYLAVDSALASGEPPYRTRLTDLPDALRGDLDALAFAYKSARGGEPVARDVAQNALSAARYVLGALLPSSGTLNRLLVT